MKSGFASSVNVILFSLSVANGAQTDAIFLDVSTVGHLISVRDVMSIQLTIFSTDSTLETVPREHVSPKSFSD